MSVDTATAALTDKTRYVLSDRGAFVTDASNNAATTPDDMDAAFRRFSEQRDAAPPGSPGPAFVLFFHGGLVSQDAFLGGAETLLSSYEAGGGGYPYFFVWRSGVSETISDWARDHLGGVVANPKVANAIYAAHQESLNPAYATLLDTTKPFSALDESHAAYTLGTAPNPLTATLTDRFRTMPAMQSLQVVFTASAGSTSQLTTDIRIPGAMSDHDMAMTVLASMKQNVAPQYAALPVGPIDIAAIFAAATVRVIWRNIHHRNHPGVSTMSEEVARGFGIASVGQALWNEMKSDCDGAFSKPDGVGAAFIQRLTNFASDGRPVRVVLIAHSAGSIFADAFVRAAANVPVNVTFDVVFMAAAIRSERFANLLASSVVNRITHFRSFALQYPVEQSCGLTDGQSKVVDALFPGSLLYVIAGILEADEVDAPLGGMDRFIGAYTRFAGIDGDQTIINYATKQRPAVWSPTTNDAAPGYACEARTHGGMPGDLYSLASMARLIQGWV
jgi:hypothetical protein